MNSNLCQACGRLAHDKDLFCLTCGHLLYRTDGTKPDCENHDTEPAVGSCVVCGKPVCGDCAVTFENRIFCNDQEHLLFLQTWSLIHLTESEFDADAVTRNLHSAGILTRVYSARTHASMYWHGRYAPVRVFVAKDIAEKAKAMLVDLQLSGDVDNDHTGVA